MIIDGREYCVVIMSIISDEEGDIAYLALAGTPELPGANRLVR